MKTFNYTIKDEIGIHARPAGLLVNKAKGFKSKITIEKDGKIANASKLFSIMSLGVKHGDTIKVTIDGDDEAEAAEELSRFFEANL